jgi:glycine/sarcosine N-methyltransferase
LKGLPVRIADEVTRSAYDSLAANYALIFDDWDKSVTQQGQVLDRVIRARYLPKDTAKILDCSCGIGTQAIGLALRGYKVHATDLSPKAVRQARNNAKRLKAKLSFGVSDFRELAVKVQGSFDVVLSCDNSLPHLLTEKDILLAARNFREKLRPGGLCLIGIRDYDAFLPERPLGFPPVLMKDEKGERIYVQSWEWDKVKPIYRFRLFLLTQKGGQWKAHSVAAQYRAWRRKELSILFLRAGFVEAHWMTPKNSGFRQPLLVLKKGTRGL